MKLSELAPFQVAMLVCGIILFLYHCRRCSACERQSFRKMKHELHSTVDIERKVATLPPFDKLTVTGKGATIMAWRMFLALAVFLFCSNANADSYPADFSDDRILVGAAHEVFVGRVVEVAGPKKFGPRRHTRFAVEVIHSIKGRVEGRIFVDQANPNIRPDGKNDGLRPDLLKPGSTYVFATRSPKENPDKAYRLNSHPNGHALLSSDPNLRGEALKEFVVSHQRVIQLQNAYRNEIVPPVFQKDARNSFKAT